MEQNSALNYFERYNFAVFFKFDSKTYPVDVYIRAYDRQGLLRDIMQIVANESLNVINVNTASDKAEHIADMRLTVEANNLSELGRLLSKINQLPNIVEVRRTYS